MSSILVFALILTFCVTLTFTFSYAQSDSTYSGQVIDVYVDGLACPFCAHGLDQRFNKIGSVKSVTVDVDNGIMMLDIKKGKSISKREINEKIEEAGFSMDRIEVQKGEKKEKGSNKNVEKK